MCVCVCRGFSLSPSSGESISCQSIQSFPHIVLDNEVFNLNRISKDHLDLLERLLIVDLQRGAAGSVLEGHYETGHSHIAVNSNLTFTSRIKLGRNKRETRLLLCSGTQTEMSQSS